ncbi:MAG TPA: hypothetical protein VL463_33155 [Kofleriaceae bacterium]|nr:hypothetical protein [Kofleriaceae bacterium]
MRLRFLLALCLVPACGGSSNNNADAGPPDAGPLTNIGFTLPTKATHANMEISDKNWMDLGLADWSCLGTASTDAPMQADMTLTGQVVDFMNMSNGVPSAMVDAFDDINYTSPFKTLTADGSGKFTMTIPMGKERVGFKVHADGYMDTFLLNQYWDPTMTAESLNIGDISQGLATALPAFIDFERQPGTGVLAGAMRDCSKHEVSNAIATVSSVSMMPTHLKGNVNGVDIIASSFYFSVSTGLPAKHKDKQATDPDGLFTIFNLPPITGTAYLQVWGFKTDADVAKGMDGLSLLAELPSPVLADNVITGSIEPLRTK